MAKRRVLKIFECWQSDNIEIRNFIRKALKKVESTINSNDKLSYAVEIDRDTQNIVGSVDIQKVILDKIDKSDIFICDISIIGKNSKTKEPIINNNVAFELGYVCGSKKVTGNILLANSDTTDSKDLPFDIRNLRVLFFSKNNDRSATQLTNSIIDIIASYVNNASGMLYQDGEDELLKAIQSKSAPRSKAEPVIKILYDDLIELYPRDFHIDTYMSNVYDALARSTPIIRKIANIIEAAVDYEQYDVLESIYDNLERILEKCSPHPGSYHECQLEYADIICSDIVLIMLGVLIDRKRWGVIHNIKKDFLPLRYFKKTKVISMNDISELRTPRCLMEYMKEKNNLNYYFPLSILEQELQGDDIDIQKYISSGDLFYYLSNHGKRWYFPQTIGILSDTNQNMTPKFIYNYKSQAGFKTIREAMEYKHQDDAKEYVWNMITDLGRHTMFHDPLVEMFEEIGIKAKDDLWKDGKPFVAAVL